MPKARDEWLAKDRRLLAKVSLTPALLEQLETTGVLEVQFTKEPAASQLVSLDGSKALLFVGASGQFVGVLVQDLVDPDEDRELPFQGATLTIRWRDEWLLIHALSGEEVHDPWVKPPRRSP
jgi:hypothetical protein